jgi:hypothetical protein
VYPRRRKVTATKGTKKERRACMILKYKWSWKDQTVNSHGLKPMVKMLNTDSLPPRNLLWIQSQMREDGMGYFATIHYFKHTSGDSHVGWVIRGSYREIQKWFWEKFIRCLVW